MNINITQTTNTKLSDIDFNDIPFGKYTSDHMFMMDYADGEWGDFRIVPYQALMLDPQSKALQYCQCIFEGMKASIGMDGVPKLLRPDLNIKRFNLSAERMCMPVIPEDMFMQALYWQANWQNKKDLTRLFGWKALSLKKFRKQV